LVLKKPVQQRDVLLSGELAHRPGADRSSERGAGSEARQRRRASQAEDSLEGAQCFSVQEQSSGGIFDLLKETPRVVQVPSYWLSQKSSLPGGLPLSVAAFSVLSL